MKDFFYLLVFYNIFTQVIIPLPANQNAELCSVKNLNLRVYFITMKVGGARV